MAEKIRRILVAKREDLSKKSFDSQDSQDDLAVKEWVQRQSSFRLSIDAVDNEFKLKIAKTLVKKFGDKILSDLYKRDSKLTEMRTCEKMLEEILHDMKVRFLRSLKEGDQFGEQAAIRENVRTASVRCTEDTHLAYISKNAFDRLYTNIMKVRYDRRI